MKNEQIKTGRLILRDIQPEDAIFIVGLRSDPAIYKYFKNPVKIDIESHNCWYSKSYICDDDRVDMIAIEVTTGERVGVFGIRRLGSNVAELSYILSPDMMGKGYATEAMNTIIAFFSEDWDINRFIAEIHKDNQASIYFIEKLGFKKASSEGEFNNYVLYKN